MAVRTFKLPQEDNQLTARSEPNRVKSLGSLKRNDDREDDTGRQTPWGGSPA